MASGSGGISPSLKSLQGLHSEGIPPLPQGRRAALPMSTAFLCSADPWDSAVALPFDGHLFPAGP